VKVIDWKTASPDARRAALARPAAETREEVFRQAANIVSAVRAEGDAAVRRFTAQFGGASLSDLRVSAAEFREARASLSPDQVAALERAVKTQDALQYTEPPYWFYPVRQSLGAAYLRAKRPADAERAFNEDLAYFKNNGWSLWGLGEALSAQGKDPAKTREALKVAWQYSDLPAGQVLK